MKLGTIKRISRDDIAKSGDVPKWLDALLEPLNQFIEKSGLALGGGLTLEDNALTKRIHLKFTHNTEQVINPFPVGSRNLSVDGVFWVDAEGQAVTSFKWVRKTNGSIGVTFKFDGGLSDTTANCTVYILLR